MAEEIPFGWIIIIFFIVVIVGATIFAFSMYNYELRTSTEKGNKICEKLDMEILQVNTRQVVCYDPITKETKRFSTN